MDAYRFFVNLKWKITVVPMIAVVYYILSIKTFKQITWNYCIIIDSEKELRVFIILYDAVRVELLKSGLSCKMLNMLKSSCQDVTSCVKDSYDNSISQLFDISLGVHQGASLSPLQFILFINAINDLNFEKLTCNDIDRLSLPMLFFCCW